MPLLRFRRRARSAPSGIGADLHSRRLDTELGTEANRDNHELASVGSITEQKAALRMQMRKQRKAIPLAQRHKAARELARQFHRYRVLQRARHVAVYLAMGSELDTGPLIARLLQRGVAVYAPRLVRNHNMRFISLPKRVGSPRRMRPHQHGMREPRCGRARPVRQMDAMLLPLLAYDQKGNRLGQGGGYYDRALERRTLGTLTVGLGYAAQCVQQIPRGGFDIPLCALLTPR